MLKIHGSKTQITQEILPARPLRVPLLRSPLRPDPGMGDTEP